MCGLGLSRRTQTIEERPDMKAQAVERAFPRPRDEAVVKKADREANALCTCAL
jgi:hypothetical protein